MDNTPRVLITLADYKELVSISEKYYENRRLSRVRYETLLIDFIKNIPDNLLHTYTFIVDDGILESSDSNLKVRVYHSLANAVEIILTNDNNISGVAFIITTHRKLRND